MCIGIPMQVLTVEDGFAVVQGHDETRRVTTRLINPPAPGEWLLVFLGDAREAISAERASEVNATLDLVLGAMGLSDAPPALAGDDPGFALPSAMSTAQLHALTHQA